VPESDPDAHPGKATIASRADDLLFVGVKGDQREAICAPNLAGCCKLFAGAIKKLNPLDDPAPAEPPFVNLIGERQRF
jgi:hypothetical protein